MILEERKRGKEGREERKKSTGTPKNDTRKKKMRRKKINRNSKKLIQEGKKKSQPGLQKFNREPKVAERQIRDMGQVKVKVNTNNWQRKEEKKKQKKEEKEHIKKFPALCFNSKLLVTGKPILASYPGIIITHISPP